MMHINAITTPIATNDIHYSCHTYVLEPFVQSHGVHIMPHQDTSY